MDIKRRMRARKSFVTQMWQRNSKSSGSLMMIGKVLLVTFTFPLFDNRNKISF